MTVITDYVGLRRLRDTESVIIVIRKVLPENSGAHTIDCAMNNDIFV